MALGIVSPVAFGNEILGLIPSITSPMRKIGDIVADITIEEDGRDELEITEHPVEEGASITDHAYKRPAEITIHIAFSNASEAAGGDPNYCSDRYNDLLTLQSGRNPVDIITGQRAYSNMLLRGLTKRTDQESETSLFVTVMAKQVIIVSTQTSPIASNVLNQSQPQKTGQVSQQGTVQLSPQGP